MEESYKIITGATQDRATDEIIPIYREVSQEAFIAWMRPILDAAKALKQSKVGETLAEASASH